MKKILLSAAMTCIFFTHAEAQCVNAYHMKRALVTIGKNLAEQGESRANFGRAVNESLRSRGQQVTIAADAQKKVSQGRWGNIEALLNDPRIVIVGTARPVNGVCQYRVAGRPGILYEYQYRQ